MVLSPIDKIKLARAHKYGHWLEEGVTSLVDGGQRLSREELAMLGWETAALILWIKDQSSSSPRDSNMLSFRKYSIKCGFCDSSASLLSGSHDCSNCGSVLREDEELQCANIPPRSGTADVEVLIMLKAIKCNKCGGIPFFGSSFTCSSCLCPTSWYDVDDVRISLTKSSKVIIKEVFGEEIKELSISIV